MATVVVANIHKSFAQKGGCILRVLEGLSFDVKEGESVCLVGPSGCGKTTILLIIASLLAPDSGTASILGRDGAVASDVDVGLVFQDYNKALMPWRTVLKNVEIGLELRGMPKKKRGEVARRQIKRVGLDGFEGSYPYQLSGGMRQRVQIARVMAYQPEVLLMDEPFGSLDSQTRFLMQDQLLDILDEFRTTTIFVTHDISEALYLGDRVVLLSAHPARILDVLELGFRADRKLGQDPRHTEEFVRLSAQIWSTMRQLAQRG